jgi:hypothetical protein
MVCRNMIITVIPLLSQGFFYVLLAYQVKSTMDGYRAEQTFSTVLHHSSGLAIGFEDRRLSALLGMHWIYFVRLYKTGL